MGSVVELTFTDNTPLRIQDLQKLHHVTYWPEMELCIRPKRPSPDEVRIDYVNRMADQPHWQTKLFIQHRNSADFPKNNKQVTISTTSAKVKLKMLANLPRTAIIQGTQPLTADILKLFKLFNTTSHPSMIPRVNNWFDQVDQMISNHWSSRQKLFISK